LQIAEGGELGVEVVGQLPEVVELGRVVVHPTAKLKPKGPEIHVG
jgi:hypothetical protein